MATVKMTINNYDNIINTMKNNTNAARTDVFYLSNDELNLKDVRDLAWKKNVVVLIEPIDEYVSKLTFSTLLT